MGLKDIELRTLQPPEWRAYRDLRRRALRDAPDAFGSTIEQSLLIPDEEWAARLTRVKSDYDHPLVAILGNELKGLLWSRVEANDASVARLYQMWVAPEIRGHGVGRTMVQTALAWMRGIGVKRAILGVTNGDRPARRLYDAMGFQPIGELEPLREGSSQNVQEMTLDL